jgi:hypothetical protein
MAIQSHVARTVLAAALLAACADPFPRDALLLGGWGSPSVALLADSASVQLEYACWHVNIPGPVLLDDRGAFNGPGTRSFSGGAAGGPPATPEPVIASGRVTSASKPRVLQLLIQRLGNGPLPGVTDTLLLQEGFPAVYMACPDDASGRAGGARGR